jgi:hypothetical protein
MRCVFKERGHVFKCGTGNDNERAERSLPHPASCTPTRWGVAQVGGGENEEGAGVLMVRQGRGRCCASVLSHRMV